MARYSFYVCGADGSADAFLERDLDDDVAAESTVGVIVTTHPRCTSVDVWRGPRHVRSYQRIGSVAQVAPTREIDRAQSA